ncbi:MAG: metallophosphoesterase [Treponema sp.]|jgi:hypothetical protein|nr:metallophosphoesterase [Treponema sp.]
MRYAIGDVHGRPFWKNYLDDDFSAFYLVGDYFDTHGRGADFKKQYGNFNEICAAARKDRRLKLCLGNHDYHYLQGVRNQRYSGFQETRAPQIGRVLEDNLDLLNVVYVTEDRYLISHAGVTAWFLASIGGKKPEDINAAFRKDRNILNFNGFDPYGDDITQSPIWVRPGALREDPLPGYHQIAGHTPVRAITEVDLNGGLNKLILIDTPGPGLVYRF